MTDLNNQTTQNRSSAFCPFGLSLSKQFTKVEPPRQAQDGGLIWLFQLMAYVALASFSTFVSAQTAPAETRGELLYSTHCVTCHTTQMHWRNNRQASDWDSLKFQVRRWQSNTGLAWNEADITEVSRYLNETIYHYPQVNDRVGLISGSNVPPVPQR